MTFPVASSRKAAINKMFYDQDRRWANLVNKAILSKHPIARRARAFLDREWSRTFNHWLDIATKLRGDVPDAALDELLGFFHNSLYPAARNAGFPDSSFVFPDIELEGAESRYPVPDFSRVAVKGAHNMYDIVGLEEFANRCCFSQHGNILTARCHLRDATGQVYTFERSVDLGPAIDLVSRNLAAWHAAQHGEEATVAGWTDIVKKAVNTVKKVAQNKTVRSLYNQAKPYIKSAVKDLPGGETALNLASKAANVYDKAKKGSQQALQAVKQVKQLAESGDAKAKFAIKVMEGVKEIVAQKEAGVAQPVLPEVAAALQEQGYRGGRGYYNLGITAVSGEDLALVGMSGAARAAQAAAKRKAIKKANKNLRSGVRDQRGGTVRQSKRLNAAWMPPKRGPGLAPPPLATSYQTRATAPMPTSVTDAPVPGAMPVPPPLASEAVAPSPAQTTPDLPSDYYDEQEQWEDYYEQEGGDEEYYEDESGLPYSDDEVSGWRLNRGYRTVSQHLLQSQHSPGIGIAAREIYNRGLGRPATSLTQLAREALSAF